jgi:hypothetical protein
MEKLKSELLIGVLVFSWDASCNITLGNYAEMRRKNGKAYNK